MDPIRVLSPDQMERIHQAALKILATTGMAIDHDDARAMLEKFGCAVDAATQRVRVPAALGQQVVDRMRKDYLRPDRPERMPVRFSHVRFRPAPHRVHADFTVSAGGFVPFIYDLDGVRRRATGDDVLCALNMVNHLDEIQYTGLPCSDQTIPARHRPVAMCAQLAKYTRKLGGVETFEVRDVGYIHEIARIVAGSEENFRRAPALVGYAEVRSPLCFDRNMVEIFLEYVRRGIPQTVDCMPSGGATAPMSAAGVLALGAAESIAPMVLAYALRDDPIVAMDITPSYADMSSGLYRYSGPERCNLLMARVQLLSEYYGCPAGVHGGKTDSCFFDERAGADKIASMLLPVLAGAVAIGTVGHLENAVTFSPVQLVIDDVLAAYTRRALRCPLDVSDEALAVEGIDRVGPGGNFLTEPETAERFRQELLLSPLLASQPWDAAHRAEKPADTAAQAAERARALWRKPDAPVLSEAQVRAIDAVVARASRD